MRVAFVGQSTFFRACALEPGAARGIDASFVEFRKDADPARLRLALERLTPDVTVVFRPEVIPSGLLDGLPGLTLGMLTEPLPRDRAGVRDEDLERRLWELGQVDPTGFDRVVTFDPFIARTADAVLPVWRSVPLPVSDRFYSDPRRIGRATGGQPLFVGRSTPHREAMLREVKHRHDVLHLAFGVDADMLEEVMAGHEIAINIHNQPYLSFENRVCLHLAAGHLVLSEPLSPLHGLEPGIDLVEFSTPGQLEHALSSLRRTPGMWHGVRVRGRRKAEQFRASRVWPRLLGDLQADVAAFSSPRR